MDLGFFLCSAQKIKAKIEEVCGPQRFNSGHKGLTRRFEAKPALLIDYDSRMGYVLEPRV